jgi:hypothetical protein
MNKYMFFFFLLFLLFMINLTATALEIQVSGFPQELPIGSSVGFIDFVIASVIIFFKLISFQVVGGIPVIFSLLLYPVLLTLLWYIVGMMRGSS